MVAALLCLVVLKPAVAQGELNYNLVHLQAESSREVANDLAQATLAVETRDNDPARVADAINTAMTWAMAQVKSEPKVRAESGGYYTGPIYDHGNVVGWRGSQELRLESTDATALSTLVGGLQERLQVKAMGFAVSREARLEVENALIEDALAAFRERAEIVRESLGAKSFRIVDISVGAEGMHPPPQPRYRVEAMAVSKAVAAPALEAGSSRVVVTVSGRVQLD